jgi:hypothetical protein
MTGDTNKMSIPKKQIPSEIPLTTDDFADMIVDIKYPKARDGIEITYVSREFTRGVEFLYHETSGDRKFVCPPTHTKQFTQRQAERGWMEGENGSVRKGGCDRG